MDKIQVEIVGLSATPSSGGAYAILLREVNGSKKLPIVIGAFEAQAIALELEGIKPPRPLSHDLMRNVIDYLGGNLAEVQITDLKDNTYYGKLILEMSSIVYDIDCRPSDAIALAVRFRCPIYVNVEVMKEAAMETAMDDEEPTEEYLSNEDQSFKNKNLSKESSIAKIQAQLREAIEKEEYERAAKLRDELKKLSGEEN